MTHSGPCVAPCMPTSTETCHVAAPGNEKEAIHVNNSNLFISLGFTVQGSSETLALQDYDAWSETHHPGPCRDRAAHTLIHRRQRPHKAPSLSVGIIMSLLQTEARGHESRSSRPTIRESDPAGPSRLRRKDEGNLRRSFFYIRAVPYIRIQ